MTAQFAVKLNKAITAGKIKCNLKGIALGDSWISPIDSVLTWAPFLFSTSLLDNPGFTAVNSSAYSVKAALDKSQFKKATELWEVTETLISKATNGVNVYNILSPGDDSSTAQSQSYLHAHAHAHKLGAKHLAAFHSDDLSKLMNGKVKEELRIIPKNVTWGGQSQLVFEALAEDFMKPVTMSVEALLNHTQIDVNVYNGQLDMIVDTMGTMRWVEEMTWPGIPGWKGAKRQPIMINGSTEGFVKSFKNLNFYWILKAGHMVPADAPATGVELLQLITNQKHMPS
jgi:serine carboxypeptidase 1